MTVKEDPISTLQYKARSVLRMGKGLELLSVNLENVPRAKYVVVRPRGSGMPVAV